MSPENRQLHVVFLPFMAPGHTIPMLDIARLFVDRDYVKATVITTPLNAPNITKSLENCTLGVASTIDVHIIPFPSHKTTGLPEGVENLAQVTSADMSSKLLISLKFLKDPLARFLEETRPGCLIADYFFPFATEIAEKFNVPRLVFRGTGYFPTCAEVAVHQYNPHSLDLSNDEPFIIPTFPHNVTLTKTQVKIPENKSELSQVIKANVEARLKSFGDVFNSFYELEPDYVDYYQKVLKRKGWHIGPVSLSNRRMNPSISDHGCLDWLDSRKPCSVIYICFGSTTKFSNEQLQEIAMALEQSGESFIWVLQKWKEGEGERWFDGFEERMLGKGLIVRGWAPQVLILEHRAIGGFVTHCGWNSILEGISAGVPMVTWPTFGDQFYNEKLVTDILKIGVQVGSKQWSYLNQGTFLTWEKIEVALKAIMKGDEALEMRSRAKMLKDMAREAVKEGGSSYCDLSSLIQELRSRDVVNLN